MSLITFKTFHNSAEAHIFKIKLEEEEIPCFLFDEHTVTLNPLYNTSSGGIKLKIDEKHLEIAQKLFNESTSKPYLDEQNEVVSCSQCSSTKVTVNYANSKGWKSTLGIIGLLISTALPFLQKASYVCKDCGHQFKLSKKNN